jgi:DNA-binding transcriptional LysR family regulator
MKKSDRSNVDFAALRTLRMVHELGSFSLAARRLDVRQSTVSYTIDRLRRIFADPLFVPTAAGIQPTERCNLIARGAARLLERYDELSQPKSFDPGTVAFDVTIAFSHQQRMLIGVELMRFLRKTAPGVRMTVINGHRESDVDLLAGSCDILITPATFSPGAFYHRRLLSDRFVCIVDRDHPKAGKSFTYEEFAAANHVLVSREDVSMLPHVATLDAMGLHMRTVLDLPSTSELEHFIAGTDLVATVAECLARTGSQAVAIARPPFDHRLDINMYWTERTHRLETMRWIRELVIRKAQKLSRLP